MLDAPYKMHSGAQPSTHTLGQCSFARRLSQGEALPAAPGAQAATQAPAPGPAPAPPSPHDGRLHDDYPHQYGAFVVFTSEGDDKHSQRQCRRELDVLFGDKAHFRCESIWFKVVDLISPYHTLLGRPALARFMVIPHYAYLKMKMPGPKGIITIAGDYKKSLECAQDSSRLADAMVIAKERRQIDRLVAQATEHPAIPTPLSQSASEGSFKPAKETK
ncbi:hypothetical protein ZWY2020_035889 [Hordeum vulgare]|nr:hypothetical protein ZWY2020_035889 [Hordeum vulgare]